MPVSSKMLLQIISKYMGNLHSVSISFTPPPYFHRLKFMAVLLVITDPSRGKAVNARHGGKFEITD